MGRAGGSAQPKMGEGDSTQPLQHPWMCPTNPSANPPCQHKPLVPTQALSADTNPRQRCIPHLTTHRGSVPTSRLLSSSPECLSHRSSLSSL